MLKVVVKVGEVSNIHLSNCELYRAITMDELEVVVSKDSSIGLAIIEGIYSNEQEQLRQFIRNFEGLGNKVVFYITDKNEAITSGIADEFEHNILMTKEALQEEIKRITGANVSTKIKWNETYTQHEHVDVNDNYSNDTDTNVSAEIDENTVDESCTQSINQQELDTLLKDNSKLKNTIDGLTAKLAELRQEIENKDREKIELEKYISKIKDESDKAESAVKEAIDAKEATDEKVVNLENSLNELQSRLSSTRNELDAKAAEFNIAEESHVKEKERLEKEVEKLKQEVASYSEKKDELETDLENRLEESRKSEEEIIRLNAELDKLRSDILRAKEEIEDKDSVITEKEEKINELNDKIERLNNRIIELSDSSEIEDLQLRYDELEVEKLSAEAKLEGAEKRYSELMQQIGGDITIIDSIKRNNDTLNNINKSLKERVVELEGKCEVLQGDNKRLNTSISTLKENSERLRESIEAAAQVGGGNDAEVPAIKYGAKGKIIHIFGHGSYGITTTAMSIAVRLGQSHRVCVVDLDITSPSLDQWTGSSPYVKEYIGIDMQLRTGLGILIKQGFKAFMSASGMIKTIKSSKAGTVDCIYGLYARLQSREIAMAEYSKLLEYIGENYDYIIVDSGRTGESIVHDSLISDVCNIAYKNIYVINGSSVLQVNSAIVKLRNSNIDTSRVMAFINMCTNSGISQNVKGLLKGMTYEIMHADTNLVFKNRPYFTENKLTRERFEAVIKEVL